MNNRVIRTMVSFLMAGTLMLGISACNDSPGEPPAPEDTEKDYSELLKDYTPSESTVTFSDEGMENVSVEPTFEIERYTNTAEGILQPYYIFTDGMCLQRDSVLRIFGTAPVATKKIAVSFREKVYYGRAENGNWEVYLPKMTAGGPFEMEIISNIGRVGIHNVYVGEVYLLSGQSNMEFTSYWNNSAISDLYEDAEACKNEKIRLANVQQKREIGEPAQPKLFEKEVSWLGANATSIKGYSAVGYIFGREMQKKLGCPVGLVCNAMGGSLIEYWMSQDAYTEYRANNTSYLDKSNDVLTNSLGFNGSVYPLGSYVFRGVVWYQGESNVNGTQSRYANALRALINDWRTFFRNENLTFTLCELARFSQDPLGYSTINEKINEVAKEDDKVAVAINVDGGDWNDIHPADKHAIGTRAATETLRLFFGKAENSAPKLVSAERVDEKTAKLILDKPVILRNGGNGFEIKTSVGWEYDLAVSAEGNVIVISSDKEFTEIRYGYRTKITTEVREDVSKFVTVFDEAGYPMDLFTVKLP